MMGMKYLLLSVMIVLIPLASVVSAQEIDLSRSPIYVKKGFSPEWTLKLPSDRSWIMIPPALVGKRSVRGKRSTKKTDAKRFCQKCSACGISAEEMTHRQAFYFLANPHVFFI